MLVSCVAVSVTVGSTLCGIKPSERITIKHTKPAMNHGTMSRSRVTRLGRLSPGRRHRLETSERQSTTGPSIKTRTSLISVPTWLLNAPTGNVAATTCGTA